MTAPWRVIDLTEFEGDVFASKGHLNAGDKSAALEDIVAILFGTKNKIHSSVFDRAAVFEVVLLHCNWAGVPISSTVPWSENTRVAARHIAQANLDLPRQKNAWMRIVKAKVRGQAYNLRSVGDAEGQKFLSDLADSVRSGDPANVEGQAAKYYWRRFFQDRNFRRIVGAGNSYNAPLNYGYTILRGRVLRSILEAGLWPSLGIWHSNRSNTFALADDLIEPFRPAVDLVAKSVGAGELDRDSKKKLSAVLDLPVLNSDLTLSSEISKFSQRFANYVEGREKFLSVPIFGGEYEEA
ncbi:MAG: type II CRISPR-associated endonuclease Cas1 [Actinomycetota bacterium]|nr:type II CRISPR-associated endonuclease Cas1 [Actinomycetota bacterium]